MTIILTSLSPQDEDKKQAYPQIFLGTLKKRIIISALIFAMIALLVYAFSTFEISLARLQGGLMRISWFFALMLPPSPGNSLPAYVQAMGETLAISFLGTFLAAFFAFPISLLAAKNIIPNIFIHFTVRRFFDTIRGIEVLIWALIWVTIVGLGPFAGLLAVASSDFGSFGKLFSESMETADRKAAEGIRACGGNRLEEIRLGLLPEVMPVMIGQVLYFIESNVRSATIIGIVGAGGIGLHLAEQIRTLEWQHVSFILIMILICVIVIDTISARLRTYIMG